MSEIAGIHMPQTLAEMEAAIKTMPKARREALVGATQREAALPWIPMAGPQTTAYWHLADELLYGGAAGGGKSDLVLGLALTAHLKSLIFRRQSKDLDELWDRALNLINAKGSARQQNSVKMRLETHDRRVIEMSHLELPGSEKTWQGRPHDLIAFDEAAQLDVNKVQFVLQWLRSTVEGQRCRVVFATNPPIPELKGGRMIDTGVGAWLKEWFAPWIDPAYPNPAERGELRWCYTVSGGERLVTKWVAGPGWYDIETGERFDANDKKETRARARSRTFIQSLVDDNVFLTNTGYKDRLSSSPEPLRSMLLKGRFGIKLADHDMQIIPTNFVLQAQERWQERVELIERDHTQHLHPMLVLCADIAQGGIDSTALSALREDNMFDRLQVYAGAETPTGNEVVARLLMQRTDGAFIVLDGGGGFGGSTRDQLANDHNIRAHMFNAAHGSQKWAHNLGWKFYNMRAEMWWLFREALEPKSGEDIMLPPSDVLLAQLTAPHFSLRGKHVLVESKEDLRRRLGSSTDEADTVLMAWALRKTALAMRLRGEEMSVAEGGWNPGARAPKGQMPEIDPLAGW